MRRLDYSARQAYMIQLPQTPSFDLVGKHALITGASSGIGLALAAALAQAGAKVTVAARREDQLQALVTALKPKVMRLTTWLWTLPMCSKP